MFRDWANPRRPLTFQSYSGRQDVIFTIDPDNLQAVFARQFHDFGKGQRFDHLRPFLGDSIFINDGEKWKSARELLRPHLSDDRISDMCILNTNVDALLSYIQRHQDKSSCVMDVEDMFLRYTLDVSTEFLLGTNPDTLQELHVQSEPDFHVITTTAANIARAGPLAFLVPQARYREALKLLNDQIEPYVRRALEIQSDGSDFKSADVGGSFLHSLAKTERDPQFLRDAIVTVRFAGRDTTSSTLTWLLYELSRYPLVWQRARAEVISVVGGHGQPKFQDLKRMGFVRACINETLRLYPLVPFSIREALTDTTLPRGGGASGMEPIYVPKGTAVSFSTLFLQRNVATYHDILAKDPDWPDPRKFDPARWLDWTPKAWTYLPFNRGPRVCLGQRFALTQLTYTIARLLLRYEGVESVGCESEPELMCNLTICPSTKIQLKFKECREVFNATEKGSA